MLKGFTPHPLNAPGGFYVEHRMCIRCHAPYAEAPDLMAKDDDGDCYFRRQPETPTEVEAAISACVVSCVKAVRYQGTDPNILARFRQMRAVESCDAFVKTGDFGTRAHDPNHPLWDVEIDGESA